MAHYDYQMREVFKKALTEQTAASKGGTSLMKEVQKIDKPFYTLKRKVEKQLCKTVLKHVKGLGKTPLTCTPYYKGGAEDRLKIVLLLTADTGTNIKSLPEKMKIIDLLKSSGAFDSVEWMVTDDVGIKLTRYFPSK